MPRTLAASWIESYLLYTSRLESPEEFHVWVALSMLAGAIRRKVYFDMGYFMVYPNLYIVLTSPAGRCKKSTAIRTGRELLEGVPGVKISGDSNSREKLAMDMSAGSVDGHASITAISSELGTFFTTSSMDMVTFLTDIYDCPNLWAHKTKTVGTTTIKAAFLNLLAGTTPDWIASSMPLETVGIGFTSRVLFVYSQTPRTASPFPRLSDAQIKIKEILKRDLAHIASLSGEFKITDEAFKWYEEWYIQRFSDNREPDARTAGYHERKHIHLLKTAMLVSLAEKDELLITKDNLEIGLGLLEAIEPGMTRAFSAVGRNPLSLDIELIDATVQRHPGGIAFSALLDQYKNSVDKEQLIAIMDTLNIIRHVKVVAKGSETYYFPRGTSPEDLKSFLSGQA